jgi:F-type H+-transporting ATPase subunit b
VKYFRQLVFAFLLVFAVVCVIAQEPAASPSPAADRVEVAQPKPAEPANATHESVSEQLAQTSQEAAGEEEEGAEFKHSPSVKFVAKITGLSLDGAYWLMVFANFAIIGGLVVWALKKNLPAVFRTRTDSIRKSMDEARRASEEANRRLGDIEGRLSKLDSEIAEMKSKAETDAAAEERRIQLSAEEDGRKIVQSAEEEIEAAAKAARRNLKAYTAELAVALAEKRIQVDQKTDQALVNTFVRQLGKDGR